MKIRYSLTIMTTHLTMVSTITHAISTDVKASVTFSRAGEVNQTGQHKDKKSRWQNAPGIRVSLQSQFLAPGIEDYRRLRPDGRRKINTRQNESDQTMNNTVAYDSSRMSDQPRKSVVSPVSSSVLESFIRQMGGSGQSQFSGSYINVTV